MGSWGPLVLLATCGLVYIIITDAMPPSQESHPKLPSEEVESQPLFPISPISLSAMECILGRTPLYHDKTTYYYNLYKISASEVCWKECPQRKYNFQNIFDCLDEQVSTVKEIDKVCLSCLTGIYDYRPKCWKNEAMTLFYYTTCSQKVYKLADGIDIIVPHPDSSLGDVVAHVARVNGSKYYNKWMPYPVSIAAANPNLVKSAVGLSQIGEANGFSFWNPQCQRDYAAASSICCEGSEICVEKEDVACFHGNLMQDCQTEDSYEIGEISLRDVTCEDPYHDNLLVVTKIGEDKTIKMPNLAVWDVEKKFI